MGEEVHRHSGNLVDHRVTDAGAEVAQIVFARHVLMQAGELPIASSLGAVMQIATKLSVIDVLIHFGGHFEYDEACRVVAGTTSGAIVGGTKGAGELPLLPCKDS
jgi:hypothetical protein